MINLKKIILSIILSILVISIGILNIPTPTIYKSNYIEFYDINNNLINSQINNKEGEYIHLNDLSSHTINAFIAFEDKNFYKHKGFDILRIVKSLFKNIITLSFNQGASTITQQYARTIFLSNKKSIVRKIKEAYYTIKLEAKYSKTQILEGYLNTIYLGHGCYGIDAASKYYFNKSAKELSLEEAATLASLPSSPTNSSPYINYQKSKERKQLVLQAMKEEGYISLFEYKDAANKDINLSINHSIETNINYYLDKVKEDINSLNISMNKGIKVYTNLDMELYYTSQKLLEKYYSSKYQISLIILENYSNKVLLDIGGFDYNQSKYNRSIHSKRQIGSTIKTFLYSFALENNFTLNTTLFSQPTTFKIKNYGEYSPTNSNNKYANRKINMKEAYAVSDNIYAVKTLLLLGSDNFSKYLTKFNLSITESVPSIALGSSPFSLYELVKAYSVYSNDGYYYNYNFINYITDGLDKPLHNNPLTKKQVLNQNIVNQTKILMTTPFTTNNYYTKSTLANYNIIDYYGKSGSTANDSYLILLNDKYTIGIWLGTDNNEQLYDYTTTKYLLKDLTDKLK